MVPDQYMTSSCITLSVFLSRHTHIHIDLQSVTVSEADETVKVAEKEADRYTENESEWVEGGRKPVVHNIAHVVVKPSENETHHSW